MLYNGGHADSKDRVGEKHGVRGAERGLSTTPPGWRLSGEEWADFPTDCDVCIEQLLATDAVVRQTAHKSANSGGRRHFQLLSKNSRTW